MSRGTRAAGRGECGRGFGKRREEMEENKLEDEGKRRWRGQRGGPGERSRWQSGGDGRGSGDA